MPRFFIKMAYDGGPFHGWQRQLNAISVQQIIEEAIAIIFRGEFSILGCGRTDTGVHASCFYFHVDLPEMNDTLLFKLNSILPKSIVLYDFWEVDNEAHARFDAIKRSYRYYAHSMPSPFLNRYSAYILELKKCNLKGLNEVASLLLSYDEYAPFCKKHADNKTMVCQLSACQWTFDENQHQYVLFIESDRFLRGMVRLIAGTCILVARGDLDFQLVRKAMETQTRLPKNLSVPAEGLFLDNVIYPFINNL